MTTIDTASPPAVTFTHERTSSILHWVTTSDHKRLGRLLVGGGLFALLGVAAVGALLGFERIDASSTELDGGAITQL
ncbi:MAG: hypothetical protein ABIW84_01310, partial [Ilumatobacteraceae bacterium]